MSTFSRRGLIKTGLVGTMAGTLASMASAKESAEVVMKNAQFDVVIIGAGCAGLTAAIEATNQGAKVAVLEKMPTSFCNTIYAGGMINASNSSVWKEQGISEDVETFYNDMMKVSMGRGDPKLTRKYAEEVGKQIDWLREECGVKFRPVHKEAWLALYRVHVVTGELKPGGAQLIKQLTERAKALGVEIFTNTKAIELLRDKRLHCLGVRALCNDEVIDFYAKGGVIICSGGFHANQEMVTKFMGGVALMPIRGSHFCTGENIQLSAPFFPKFVNLDQFHGGPIHGPTGANPSILVNYGILIKKDGTRFIDEVNTYVRVAKALPKLVPENWAYIVMDGKSLNVDTMQDRLDRYQRAKAPLFQANTLVEAARLAGLPEKQVEKTVQEYNKAVKAGKAASLVPPNTLENAPLVDQGPFLIIPFQGGMTATFGGPKINTKAEVINTENKAIPGLYAAGNAAGGLFYDNYIVGSQLGACLVYGREVGRQAAARAKTMS